MNQTVHLHHHHQQQQQFPTNLVSIWSLVLILQIGIDEGATPCRPPFGCFPSTSFRDLTRRPLNPEPQYPQDIQTKFYIYAKWFQPNGFVQEICGTESIPFDKFDKSFRPCLITTKDLLNKTLKLNHLRSYQNKVLTKNKSIRLDDTWTAMIIHGYRTDINRSKYLLSIKNLLLNNPEKDRQYQMVIIVDWGSGSFSSYPQACSNARLIGAEAAYLIRMLMVSIVGNVCLHNDFFQCTWVNEKNHFPNIRPHRIHLIGHSLGAHVAGYIGKKFTDINKLGRITGLDPAGPFFDHMPPNVRLDRSDGRLVDVIHTNSRSSFSFGISTSIGHVDFYPNGGYRQPGCNGRRCDHYRASKLFASSIPRNDGTPWCLFRSAHCDRWKSYGNNQCEPKFQCGKYRFIDHPFNDCAQMGFYAYRWANIQKLAGKSVDFFLRTSDHEPYCFP